MVQLASGTSVSERLQTAKPALSWVTTAARLVLAGVLIVAGAMKIGAPALSVQAVRAYQLLPDGLATAFGYGLPVLEIILGLLLVVGLLTRPVAAVGGVLMAMFIVGIASAWARGLRIDCGCFGGDGSLAAGQDPNYFWELLRDIGLFACAAWTVIKPPGRLALDSALGLTGPPEAEDGDPPSEGLHEARAEAASEARPEGPSVGPSVGPSGSRSGGEDVRR
ncbi:MauE/DoxX family redox-associated membrane protein [Microbispora sp. ATCC PTA-5024]|uniref:MauE/DoxX family redox-associated membrane protein n=1 Tax=Microbispora sp. ATCC PTA-5024 TaxID=316330 RepID=UPI0003DBE77B|nr:MauE/DoxX family redox-associated membrane protein [Microbispora sp. ATCC PTA-5024]ETK36504.1 DoxX family protein [Microbispora sp. ATCC PTA-5024]